MRMFILCLVALIFVNLPLLLQMFAAHVLFDEKLLRDKYVFVGGASTGIGEEIAYRYARGGAHVAVVARRKAQLEVVAQKCRALGAASAIAVTADLSTFEGSRNAFREVVEKSFNSRLDIMVLNHIIGGFGFSFATDGTVLPTHAGGGVGQCKIGESGNSTCMDSTAEFLKDTRKMLHVNVMSYYELATFAMPHLVASGKMSGYVPSIALGNDTGGGQLIIVGSAVARAGASPKVIPYAPTKYAVNGLADALRIELHVQKIPVSVTHCVIGEVATENQRKNTEGALNFTKNMGMSGTPNAAANAIVVGGATRMREIWHPEFEGLHGKLVYGTTEVYAKYCLTDLQRLLQWFHVPFVDRCSRCTDEMPTCWKDMNIKNPLPLSQE